MKIIITIFDHFSIFYVKPKVNKLLSSEISNYENFSGIGHFIKHVRELTKVGKWVKANISGPCTVDKTIDIADIQTFIFTLITILQIVTSKS